MTSTARQNMLLERIASALEKLAAPAEAANETVDVKEAAALLKTTPRAIYTRYERGQMPTRVPGAKRLLWRKADVLGAKR